MNHPSSFIRSTVLAYALLFVSYNAQAAITEAQAYRVFQIMQRQSDIEFRFVQDGCYARAHLMARRIQAMGVQVGKIWAWANDARQPLAVWSNYRPGGPGWVNWAYHVAPVVQVQTRSGIRNWVIDPSMFGGPVDAKVWYDAMHPRNASCKISGIDRYMVNGAVPALGADRHSMYVMRVYRARYLRGDFRALTPAEMNPS